MCEVSAAPNVLRHVFAPVFVCHNRLSDQWVEVACDLSMLIRNLWSAEMFGLQGGGIGSCRTGKQTGRRVTRWQEKRSYTNIETEKKMSYKCSGLRYSNNHLFTRIVLFRADFPEDQLLIGKKKLWLICLWMLNSCVGSWKLIRGTVIMNQWLCVPFPSSDLQSNNELLHIPLNLVLTNQQTKQITLWNK